MPLPRTTHHSDHPLPDLAARASGRTVSVVVPARNEARTVGEVVGTIRRTLVEEHRIVDEIVVVDGGSTDETAAVAAAAGATVVDQRGAVPKLPADAAEPTGKGDALWRGLLATSGELVCFVDADVHDPGPELVAGPLAPLLLSPGVGLVKAAYDRPRRTASGVLPRGGGRVTEILGRPLLAAFWPELDFVVQPLAGEYAGRRDVLEQLPFVAGYGVEIGLLVDVADLLGPEGIAQVDLGVREHDHQPLAALGVMAAEILTVALRRAQHQGRLDGGIHRDPGQLAQPVRGAGEVLELRTTRVAPAERPPARELRDLS